MTGYAIIIEGEGSSFSAYSPELPGCVSTGSSVAEVETRMQEATKFHLDMMRERGDEIPVPSAVATAIAEVVPSQ
jgi:predicted RNase H-like HicB family nuclease